MTGRGNSHQPIVRDDKDHARFLATLAQMIDRYGRLYQAYCLMDNRDHLLVDIPRPTLSQGMRQLNGVYVQAFNRRHGRVGHLFEDRFRAILVEKDAHLSELCRSVVLNPVGAKLATHAG
ncbi:MAG: transposase [Nitrospiraceae bacterium]